MNERENRTQRGIDAGVQQLHVVAPLLLTSKWSTSTAAATSATTASMAARSLTSQASEWQDPGPRAVSRAATSWSGLRLKIQTCNRHEAHIMWQGIQLAAGSNLVQLLLLLLRPATDCQRCAGSCTQLQHEQVTTACDNCSTNESAHIRAVLHQASSNHETDALRAASHLRDSAGGGASIVVIICSGQRRSRD